MLTESLVLAPLTLNPEVAVIKDANPLTNRVHGVVVLVDGAWVVENIYINEQAHEIEVAIAKLNAAMAEAAENCGY